MDSFLSGVYFGNTIKDYLIALGIFVSCIVFLELIYFFVLRPLRRWAEKTANTFDDFLVTFFTKTVMPLLFLASFYLAVRGLSLHNSNAKYLRVAYVIIITYISVKGLLSVIHYLLIKYIMRNEEDDDVELRKKQLGGFLTLIDLAVWVMALVFLLDNLGYNVTTLITGLGVGGIAIAIAAQAVLGDFFAYFVIFFDRPFSIGDFVEVDNKMGVIEYIGFKSTRIRTLMGDQLIVSNKDLTNARMHNYKKMERRRMLFTLGVTYQTPHEQLEAIPKIVEGVIQSVENITFDRGHFVKFGDFSLDFEFVYYVESQDYTVHINALHEVNLKIYKTFAEKGIQFAYPTQSVYIHK